MKKISCFIFIMLFVEVFPQNQISEAKKIEVQNRVNMINQLITQKGLKWKAGITSHSYLSHEELLKIWGGEKEEKKCDLIQQAKPVQNDHSYDYSINKTTTTIPDWKSLMSPVEAQQSTNCWAHASTDVVEGKLHLFYTAQKSS